MTRKYLTVIALCLPMVSYTSFAADAKTTQAGAEAKKATSQQIARGRYLLTVGNCNDCHTAGFAPSEGKVPEAEWLLGDSALGFRGPWGTTYATNLRLSLSKMTETEWVKYAKGLKARPPMPWFNLNPWNEADLKAFYRYVRSLGPVGDPVREPIPPGQEPPRPYIHFPDKPPPKK
jgi:mono/diheme cytochrome c family protein